MMKTELLRKPVGTGVTSVDTFLPILEPSSCLLRHGTEQILFRSTEQTPRESTLWTSSPPWSAVVADGPHHSRSFEPKPSPTTKAVFSLVHFTFIEYLCQMF